MLPGRLAAPASRGARRASAPTAVALAAALALPVAARADELGRELLGALAALAAEGSDTASRARSSDQAGAARQRGLAELLPQLERRHAAQRARFDDAARRGLPAKARERLDRAREAHTAGQGRLLELLRSIDTRRDQGAPLRRSELAREAHDLLARLMAASRQEPLSAELKLRAPTPTAPALPAASGTTSGSEASLGPVPPSVRALAESLAGPIEAYAWVRNTVRTEFYAGSLKGPAQTLLDRTGNDADTAGLLIALLRAQGVPARFAQGTVRVDAGRLQAVTGTSSPELALRVLERAGIPHEPVLGGAGLAAVKMARVWAEAYVPYANYRGLPLDAQGKLWLALDASFKDLRAPSGIDLVAELQLDPLALATEYLETPRTQTPRQFLRQRVEELLAPRNMSYEQALNDRGLAAHEALGILPNALPYDLDGPRDVSYDAPWPHELRVVAEREGAVLLDASVSLPSALGQRLTLGWVPFDADDARVVEEYGGLTRTPPYLIEVKAVLKLGGIALAAGEAPIGMAVKHDLRLSLSFPGGTEELRNTVLAGNLLAIGLAGGDSATVEPPGRNAAALLARAASEYLRGWNRSDAELADVFRVVPVRPTASACFVMSDVHVEYAGGDPLYPVTFDWKGVAVDADLRSSAPAGVEARAAEPRFNLISGLEGSILENRLFEELWNVGSISTAKALQVAGQQGTPVLTLTHENVDDLLPQLALDEQVKAEIRDAALRGFTVRVPAALVPYLAWTGSGWWILDEATGESAWQLQGGHSGGVTAAAVIDWPDVALTETLMDQGEEPAPEESQVTKISKFVSTDFQDGVVDKPLGRPFRVLVNDEDGLRVPNAPVTFEVIGGGGAFVDPVTELPTSVLTVRSNTRGEAEATLVLGKRTDEIPRFACLAPDPESCSAENEIYATQVGLNLVMVSSGAAQVREPFVAYARPDDRFDGTYVYANLSFKTYPRGAGVWNLTVAGLWAINVRDQHDNPLSNFRVRFAYRPPPVVATPPPGWQLARPEGTQTPAKLLSLRDYTSCIERTPSPSQGECPGEEEVLIAPSSTYGSVSYPVLGDSPYSYYYFDVGTEVEPALGALRLGTWGWLCTSTGNWWCKWPDHLVANSSRAVLVGPTGNLIEAYAPGEAAPLQFSAHALYEGYVVLPYVDSEGVTHYRVEGDNTWTREPLDDSVFALTPRSQGTGAEPSTAAYAGGGTYDATMVMAATPQRNVVDYEARNFPLLIPQDLPDHPGEVDPAAVDETTLQITKRKDPSRPVIRRGESALWGVRASIDSVTPSPLQVLDGRVARRSDVAHRVEPPEYLAELAPTNLWFLLSRDDTPVLAASGTDGSPFQIPAGLAFPPGDYTAQLRIPGVRWLGQESQDIASPPFPVEACQPLELLTPVVLLPLVPNSSSACETQETIRFRVCGRSAVTIVFAGDILVARLGGVTRPIDGLELEAGEYEVTLDRERIEAVLARLSAPSAPFRITAVPADTPAPYGAAGVIGISDELITLITPVVDVKLTLDHDNQHVCRQDADLVFAVCDDADVTLRVDGRVLSASIDGGPIVPLDGIRLSAGAHSVRISADLVSSSFEQQKPFRIDGRLVDDPAVQDSADGRIQGRVLNRSILPVGHTFVKGVDLADGHVVQSEVDLSVPGRHLGLEMSRTYSSASSDPEAVMGPGWNWIYGLSLEESDCDLVVLTTRDGTQIFRGPGPAYTPQRGYHGRLEKIDQVTFDYFDKAGIQHRFQRAALGTESFRLQWLREPHGDRLVMSYDVAGLLTRVVEEQDGAPVRELRITHARAGGFQRIQRVEAYKAGGQSLGLRVDYEHGAQHGNLLRATRFGTNIGGGPRADDRVQRYNYSEQDPRDRHQLTDVYGPNGERTRYQYYARTDALPGEDGETFFVLDKQERVRVVYEYPDTRELRTQYRYDLTGALQNRLRTTVEDPAGRATLYVQNTGGSVLEVREPLNKNTFVTWFPDVRKQTERDANQRLTRFTWDARGNPATQTIETGDPELGDVTTATVYDPTYSKLVSRTDGEDRITSWNLDPANGDVRLMVDPEGNRTTYDYVGGTGLLRRVTDARGNSTEYEDHNDFGQPRRIRDAEGNVTQRTYDDRGRLTLETDSFGRRTEYVYDGLDRVRQVTRRAAAGSDHEVTRKDYHRGGQLRSETNANGGRVVYDLDGLNRVTRTTTSVNGRTHRTETTYDRAGNKESETDRRGVERRFAYDDLNRLRSVRIVTGPAPGPVGEVATFDYDLVGNKTGETDVAGNRSDYVLDGLYRVRIKRLPEVMPPGHAPPGRLEEEYRHDRVGNRLSFTDANDRETRFEYDRLDRLTASVRDFGGLALRSTTRYCNAPAPDPPGGLGLNKCEEHDVASGLRTFYEYDRINRETLRTVRLEGPDGDPGVDEYVTETDYVDASHEVRVTDPNGNVTVTRLDGLDRPIERVVDSGRLNLSTRTFYDGLGNAKLVLDPRGNPTQPRHDGLGRLVRLTDATGAAQVYDYDGEGLRTLEQDRRGVRKRFEHDNLGRRTRAFLDTAPFSGVAWSQTTDHRDRDRLRIETDARGKTTRFKLDGLGRVIEETDHHGNTAFATWNGVNKVRQTDRRPAHHTTRFEYDGLNRLTRTFDPEPWAFEAGTRYLDAQNQVEETDRRGTVRLTQHDSLGRVRSVTRAVGQPEQAVLERNLYDGNGNKLQALDAEGRRSDFAYDGANRLRARTDGVGTPAAATTRYEYDDSGNQTLEQDQRARDLGQPFSVRRVYDSLNRLTDVYDGEGNHTVYGYDREGNRTLVQAPEGQRTTFAYGELAELLSVTQPSVAAGTPVTRHEYDQNRNRVRQVDAMGNEVVLQYDDLNRLEWMVQEGNLRTRHQYDENGNETVLTDPNGHVTTSTYDELNRLRLKEYAYAGGLELPWRRTLAVEYGYDPNGNLTSRTESVASGSDPPVPLAATRVYDRLDRLTSETAQTALGQSATVGYSYYANGLRRTVTDASGAVTFYEYDGQNRLSRATLDSGTPQQRATDYVYWPDGLVREVRSPNGVVATQLYDKADRLANLANARGPVVVSAYDYAYDRNGNRTRQTEVNGGLTELTTYGYDALDRLRSVTYPADSEHPTGRTVSYEYDRVGNRTLEREVDGQGTPTSNKVASFDALNRLTAVDDTVDDANDASFTYDDNGNLRTKATGGVTTTYVYDCTNRLSEVRDSAHGAPLARFQYDAEGRRLLKQGDPTAPGDPGMRQFVHDGTSVLQELDASGSAIAKYDWGGDRLVALTRGSGSLVERRYYSFDGLGSVTNLTDPSGVIAASYHLDAWGNYRFPAELQASANRFGFTGHYFDTETDLYFAKARYFDPEFGRFLTQDSYLGEVADPPSLHRYVYAFARPTSYVDESGYEPVPVGYVYVVRGVDPVTGEAVSYTGSTIQEIKSRFARHKWLKLIQAESTTIDVQRVRAEPNVAQSGRGTLRSAKTEAVRTQEETVRRQVAKEPARPLNEIKAATEEHAQAWKKTHNVSGDEFQRIKGPGGARPPGSAGTSTVVEAATEAPLGQAAAAESAAAESAAGEAAAGRGAAGRARPGVRGGATAGAFAGLAVLDAYRYAREQNMARYVEAPHVLEDEGGAFIVEYWKEGWFRPMQYQKRYLAGANEGTVVPIGKQEFRDLQAEAEALYGRYDIWGNWVPGKLRKELPVAPGGPEA